MNNNLNKMLKQTKRPRIEYNNDVKKLLNIFRIDKDNLIDIKGSYTNADMYIYGDYDFFVQFHGNYTREELYDEFSLRLRTIIENPNCYFIELKIQQLNGKKEKWFPNEPFKFSQFDKIFNYNTEFIKIDIVYFSPDNNNFIEASCNYNFNKKAQTDEELNNELDINIKELKKENNYFKVLKKIYLLSLSKNDTNKIELLKTFFNSEIGSLYKSISNINAIKLVQKYYNDALTKKRIENNLINLNYPQDYKKEFNKKFKILNDASITLYNQLYK